MAPSSSVMRLGRRGGELGDLLLGAHHEVVVAAGLNAVALAQQLGNRRPDVLDLRRRRRR